MIMNQRLESVSCFLDEPLLKMFNAFEDQLPNTICNYCAVKELDASVCIQLDTEQPTTQRCQIITGIVRSS